MLNRKANLSVFRHVLLTVDVDQYMALYGKLDSIFS